MGYAIHKVCQTRRPGRGLGRLGRFPGLLVVAVGLSLLPDVDSMAGIVLRDFGRYHNSGSHSLLIALAVAVALGGLVWGVGRSGFLHAYVLVLVCYGFHIVLDYFTVGRGVMLLWPLSSARFQAQVKLFYGLHWSDGLLSIRHLWALLSELVFAALVALSTHVICDRPGRCEAAPGSSRRRRQDAGDES